MRKYAGAPYNPSPPSPGGSSKQPALPPFGAGSGFGSSLDGRSLSSSWRYASAAQSPDSASDGRAGNGPYDAAAAQPWPPISGGGGGAAAVAPPPLASPPSPTMAMGSPTSAPGSGGGGEGGFGTGDRPAADDGSRQQLWSPSKRTASHAAQGQHMQMHQACVPPGMDPAAYAAGERAALMCAFQQALPGQQALGQLFSGGWDGEGAFKHAWPAALLPACISCQVLPGAAMHHAHIEHCAHWLRAPLQLWTPCIQGLRRRPSCGGSSRWAPPGPAA
jgi:hypothetical protein